jgi:superfamily II DNA/RNA helicase
MKNSYSARPNRGGQRYNVSKAYTSRRPKRSGTYIDPSKFVNKATTPAEQVVYEAKHKFIDFAFSDAIKRNIIAAGYETPSAIQDQAIPLILEGNDVIGLANTGTGKTAAFVLPMLERIKDIKTNGTQVLIMAPTRELATQIDDEFRKFARGLGLYSVVCVGGMSIGNQIRALSRRPQVVIGTPGRLKDLVNRHVLKLKDVSVLVLDEADQMLDMGFIVDIKFLVGQLPKERQSLCFSATMTPAIRELVNGMMAPDPAVVSVRTRETSEHVEQDVVRVSGGKEQKFEKLVQLLEQEDFEKILIFGETKFGVQRLADNLSKHGIPAGAIHGNKTQPQRQKMLNSFKRDEIRVLVATDVAARGLDIPNVSHVINFDQPQNYQDYVHRIGRTGRAGKRGTALTFVS